MLELFWRIVSMSAAAAVVIAVVLAVRLLLRRAPKKWSYLLWSAVGFRLCCPVALKGDFSVFALAPLPAARTGAEQATAYVPPLTAPSVLPDGPVSSTVTTPLPADVVAAVETAQGTAAQSTPTAAAVLAGVWLMGMLLLVGWGLYSYWKMKRLVDDAVIVRDNVYETDRIRSPFILGLLRPRIYLPAGLEGERLDYVLAHERCHLRRRDHVIRALAFALLVVHWFNPLVWLAFHLMGRDMEMSCDEEVLAAEENRAGAYSSTLLSFAAPGRFPAPSPLCFGESSVKSRIKNALAWHRPRVWVTVLAAVLCLAAVTACAVDPAFPDVPKDAVKVARGFYRAAGRGADQVEPYLYFPTEEYRKLVLENWTPLPDTEIRDIEKLSEDLCVVIFRWRGEEEDDFYYLARIDGAWRMIQNEVVIPKELTEGIDLSPYCRQDPNDLGLPEGLYDTSLARLYRRQKDVHSGIAVTSSAVVCSRETSETIRDMLARRDFPVDEDHWAEVGGSTEPFGPGEIRFLLDGTEYYLFPASGELLRADMGRADPVLTTEEIDLIRTTLLEGLAREGPGYSALETALDLLTDPNAAVELRLVGQDGTVGAAYTVDKKNNIWEQTGAADLREYGWYLHGTPFDSADPGCLTVTFPGWEGLSLTLSPEGDSVIASAAGESTGIFRTVKGDRLSVYEILRNLYDDLEWQALTETLPALIPDRGQTAQEAAQEYLDARAALYLQTSPGSGRRYEYVRCYVTEKPDMTELRRRQEEIDENTWAIYAETVFVPENPRAESHSMVGNTGGYTGDKGPAPEGAFQYSRCGYAARTPEGWQVWIVGTSW